MPARWGNPHVDAETNSLMDRVLDAAFDVHRALGPGLLEGIYRRGLAIRLDHLGLRVEKEVWMDVEFMGVRMERALRADLLVEDRIVVEIKSVEDIAPVHRAQVRTYLKASGRPAGLLLNFNVALLKDGYDRFVHPDLLNVPVTRRMV